MHLLSSFAKLYYIGFEIHWLGNTIWGVADDGENPHIYLIGWNIMHQHVAAVAIIYHISDHSMASMV